MSKSAKQSKSSAFVRAVPAFVRGSSLADAGPIAMPIDAGNSLGISRRVFMKSGALALASIGLNPSFLRRTVFAQDLLKGAALNGNARGKVLIVLFQRGAA